MGGWRGSRWPDGGYLRRDILQGRRVAKFLIKCGVNHVGDDLAALGSTQVLRSCVGGSDHIPIGAFLELFGRFRLPVTLLRR